jgi:thiosulfate/3-mercaptopyruvate sulfurtransferase
VEERLDLFADPSPEYRLLEVDLNVDFYHEGHAPSAVGLDWSEDLRAADRRDVVGPEAFAQLMGDCGISEDTTVVVYGDNANWFAAHFYWMCRYYGHDDVRLMDGGREHWLEHGYPTVDTPPTVPTVRYGGAEADESVRAYRDDVFDALGTDTKLVDVRMPEEYRGDLVAPPGYDEHARRGGHIPGATNVLWADNVREDHRFESPDRLRELYADRGITPDDDVITYCRIGERSAVTWFVLTQLLDFDGVRNYDGSWVEWGNMVGAPIERGA